MIDNVQTEELYKQMAQSIIDGESEQAVELAQKSIELNMHPLDTITKGFVVGVNYIGDQFGKGEAFLPELVMAGEAMKAAVATLEPELLKLGEAREIMGRVVLATVEGDIHEIGKTLVGTMLSRLRFRSRGPRCGPARREDHRQGTGDRCPDHRHERPAHHHHGPPA